MMIYLDTSVALAALLAESRRPAPGLWSHVLVSSRLLQYEIMNRINARRCEPAQLEAARALIDGVDLLGLQPEILNRALRPFPQAVRTLDALHLASMEFLRGLGQPLELASYDLRLNAAAQALGFPLAAI
mgnify:CR=1 FL=1